MLTSILNPSAEISFASGTERKIDRIPLQALAPLYLRLATVFTQKSPLRQPILLALPNCSELLYSIWACMAAGVPFCIVHPDRAEQFITKTLERGFPTTLVPGFVVADAGVEAHAARLGYRACSVATLERASAEVSPILPTRAEPSRIAYFQLTSGSSGLPKAVPVSWAMLHANISQMSKRCELWAGDKLVLWVPMSHDMGLISWLALQSAGARLLLMETRAFVLNPLSWLSQLTEFKGSVSAAPAFALHLTTMIARRRKARFDLSSLRVLWVGGEPVFPRIVSEFTQEFSSSGLRPEAVHATYGMAEAVVGVSTKYPAELPKSLSVCAASLRSGGVCLTESGASGSVAIMSCGKPIDDTLVEVWPVNGTAPLPEDQVGRIVIRGPNVVARYADAEEDTVNGWRDTGDVGFIHKEEVYIVGRGKNLLSRAGVKVHAEHAEEAIRSALGSSIRRVAAFSSIDHSAAVEQVIIVCETRMRVEELRGQVSAALVQRCGIAADTVLAVGRGSIPMTSSGKIRRDQLPTMFASYRGQDDATSGG